MNEDTKNTALCSPKGGAAMNTFYYYISLFVCVHVWL